MYIKNLISNVHVFVICDMRLENIVAVPKMNMDILECGFCLGLKVCTLRRLVPSGFLRTDFRCGWFLRQIPFLKSSAKP